MTLQLGHPDWQRSEQTDSGTLFTETGQTHTGAFSTPVLAVGLWETLILSYQQAANHAWVVGTVTWYADPAGTVVVGTRLFAYDGGATASQFLAHYYNLGPFVKITLQGQPAVNYGSTLYVAASNRITPLEVYDGSLFVFGGGLLNVPAGGTTTAFANGYYQGPGFAHLTAAVNGNYVSIEAETGSAIWTRIALLTATTNTNVGQGIVLPAAPLRALLQNPSAGAVNMALSVVPSPTGSS